MTLPNRLWSGTKPLGRRFRKVGLPTAGFSLLDLLITLLVLALVLLAAVKQFSVYAQKPAAQPAPQQQSTGARPPAPSQ